MGIRMDQHMGLNLWAEAFVRGEMVLSYTEVGEKVYPDGHREPFERPHYESNVKVEESGEKYCGMFYGYGPDEDSGTYDLHKYIFPDGKIYFERVQAEPWSSGPVFFLALQDESGQWVKESLWEEEEIQNAL